MTNLLKRLPKLVGVRAGRSVFLLIGSGAPMTADDLKRIAERCTKLMHPGEWPHMTDAQEAVQLLSVGKALQAALLEGFLGRKSPVCVMGYRS
jgi:hypothetical protein